MKSKYLVTILVVVLVLVGAYLLYNSGPIVSAQGYSNVNVQPDRASVYINIETRNVNAEEAKALNDKISDSVLTNLIKLGIEKKDIQTAYYNMYPEYDWSSGKQRQIGFVVTNQLVVKMNDFNEIDDVVDSAVDSGALVSGINFELSEEKQSQYKSQALKEAGEDAKEKAKATASGVGRSLGRLVSIQSEEFNYGPIVYYAKAESMDAGSANAEAKRVALNVVPTDITVDARIQVQYRLSLF